MSHSDVNTLTIQLEAGVGNFVFDSYSGALFGWACFPVKDKYKAGEDVYIHYCVKNVGTAISPATVTVKDLDTGLIVITFSVPNLEPGYRWKTTEGGPGAYVGKMPNRNWRLELTVTP